MKELEVKMELDHVFSIMDWVFAVQEAMNTTLTSVSPVFAGKKDTELQEFGIDRSISNTQVSVMPAEEIKYWRDIEIAKSDEAALYVKSYKGSPLCLELSLFK